MRKLTNGLLWLALPLLAVAVLGMGCNQDESVSAYDVKLGNYKIADLERRVNGLEDRVNKIECGDLSSHTITFRATTPEAFDEHCTADIAMVRPCHVKAIQPTPTPFSPWCYISDKSIYSQVWKPRRDGRCYLEDKP